MATSPNDPRITAAINTATAWAQSQVGKATGNSVWAIAYPQWVGTGYHWCGGFVVAAYKQAGVDLMKAAWFFYTPYIKNLAIKIGAWKTGGGNYGDMPLYDWQNDGVIDHVGISLPDPSSVQYRAVEGNTSPSNAGSQSAGGGCWVRYRPRTTISGWLDTRKLLAWMIDTGKWDGKTAGKATSPTTSTPTLEEETVSKAQYKDSRLPITLKPGEHRHLRYQKDSRNTPGTASDIARFGAGAYVITAHVYASGKAGDQVDLIVRRQKFKTKPKKNSTHWASRFRIGRNAARINTTFTPTRYANEYIFLRVAAPKNNKGPIKITQLAVDSTRLGAVK